MEAAAFTGKTVWVVDDDAYILKIFEHLFRKNRVAHRCFESAEALLAETWDPDVRIVLTDIHLPGRNGDELCMLLRQLHPSDLKIVALTTQVTPAGITAFLASGFDDVFLKPFTESDLLALFSGKPEKIVFPLLDALIEDESERAEIIQQFLEETQQDLAHLQKSVAEGKNETVLLVVHRLAGRLAQFSQEELSDAFRKMERSLLQQPDAAQHRSALEQLMKSLEDFLQKITGNF